LGYGFGNSAAFQTLVLLILLVFVVGAMPVLISMTVKVLLKRRRQGVRRGFEVKRNTGETPVLLKERENDHG
jgi:hypothetical protein